MCYTIEINLTREQLEKRFRANLNENLPYRKQQRVNAFSLPECPVICSDDPGTIRLLCWGLIPSWIKDEEAACEIRTKTFNARSESIREKPSYKHLIGKRRCLVLTNGFYEWQSTDKGKQPYFITIKDTGAFALAGLHDRWTNRLTGEIHDTFTIVTTRANPLMEKIHNVKKRMPVILTQPDESGWLNSSISIEKTMSYLIPFEETLMKAEEVDKSLFRKTSKNNDIPDLF